MRFFIEGVGLLGPGLDGWQAARAVLAGEAPHLSAPTNVRASDMLPAIERRRSGVPIKLALAVAREAFLQAGRDTSTAATVFTSSDGDCDNIHAINCILAANPGDMSPIRFHNSVHNAVAGYWCIAAKSHEASTSLCAHDASFVAGLLEAATQVVVNEAVVALVAYDHPYPAPMCNVRHIAAPFAVALILMPQKSDQSLAVIEVDFRAGKADESIMQDTELEALRCGVPAARVLPLLSALACGQDAQINMAYFEDNHLNIRISPC